MKRAVYLKSSGQSFWDEVDEKLKWIREKADTKYPDDLTKAKMEIHA